ncbi:NAD-dependent protein deacetylase hst2-1 [Dichotomopilus funicola]|uniref:NAD-dependent protein deacetylase n=1 Tax=Dichotomopilus funicola TaxID=1934379 RepID=A0AAN6V568_9PEZI|nr:NAD-dependent protein deacetylase hst2-1 [Dichotomopilus funicola]
MGQEQSQVTEDTPPLTLQERTLPAVADLIKSGRARRIVVMTGAGISTAAGIPDFRSPDTGLYANLAALNLPEPEAVFDLTFFRQNPRPFYVLARELYPGARYRPTISHVFLALLARKGLLHALFTQNIDCLERAGGVPGDRIVEAHGSFASQRCVDCKVLFDEGKMRGFVERGEVPRADDGVCGGLVKPDIVFFGEPLPRAFFDRMSAVKEADLVLVMGTSLQVHPFAGLPDMVNEDIPRVLFNLERVGSFGTQADDVMVLGDCDGGVRRLADELGWRDELEKTWRELVGDEEAERQLQGAAKRVAKRQDEVSKLADEVDQALHIGDEEGSVKREGGEKEPVVGSVKGTTQTAGSEAQTAKTDEAGIASENEALAGVGDQYSSANTSDNAKTKTDGTG